MMVLTNSIGLGLLQVGFLDSLEEMLCTFFHIATGKELVIHPDKSNGSPVHTVKQQLVFPVGFSYLPLDAVAVDGMLEMSLGHADHDLDRCRRLRLPT